MPEMKINITTGVVRRIFLYNFKYYNALTGEAGEVFQGYCTIQDQEEFTQNVWEEMIYNFWDEHDSEHQWTLNGRHQRNTHLDLSEYVEGDNLVNLLGFDYETTYLNWRQKQLGSVGIFSRLIINEENKHNQGGH